MELGALPMATLVETDTLATEMPGGATMKSAALTPVPCGVVIETLPLPALAGTANCTCVSVAEVGAVFQLLIAAEV